MALNIFASNANSGGVASSLIVAAKPAVLLGITVYNKKASSQFIQIHDSATVPADTAVPVAVFEIATLTARTIDFGYHGRPFANGIVVCNSSTDSTKTIGSSDTIFDAQFYL